MDIVTREPQTDLERRLIAENLILEGTTRELSAQVAPELGYEGVFFDYVGQKEVNAHKGNPDYLLTRCMGGIGVFDLDSLGSGFVFGQVEGRIQDFFEEQYGDRFIAMVIREATIKYDKFDVPILLPKTDIGLDLFTGIAVVNMAGHVFYEK